MGGTVRKSLRGLNRSRTPNDQHIAMKRFTSLLISCSLALAGAAMAQPPEAQSTPAKKKQGAEKANAAPAQPGANARRPQERPAKQPGAAKEHGPMKEHGAMNEPGAGKG